MMASPEADPLEADAPAAIVIVIPEGLREIRLDGATLELWLTLLEAQYTTIDRREAATAAMLESVKASLKLAHFWLRRKPLAGWDPPPARERGADILVTMARYVARNAFAAAARKRSRLDIGEVLAAQAFLGEVLAHGTGDNATAQALALPAGHTAAASRDPEGGRNPSGTGSGARGADASGSGGQSGSASARGRGRGATLRRRR